MATAKQLAWRKKFAAMAKAGTLKKAAKKATRKSNPSGKLYLWRYNKITGVWKLEREVSASNKDQWLKIFQQDEPNEVFKVSANKPAAKTTRKSNPALVGSKHAFWNLAYKYGKYAGLHEATDNPKYEKMANLAFTSLSPKFNEDNQSEFEDAYRSGFNAGMREGRKSTSQTTRKSNPTKSDFIAVDAEKRSIYAYDVQALAGFSKKWVNIAGFYDKSDALKYAKQLARQENLWKIRVVSD